MLLRITALIGSIMIVSFSQAQKMSIQNLNVTDEGEVSFTCLILPDHSKREVYELKVYSSADGYAKPLDLNLKSIKVGYPVNISFDGKKAVGNYEGTLQFRFVATASLFPVEVTIADQKFKRGKKMQISWDDYHGSGWYDVEMYKDGLLFQKLVGNHRGSSYTAQLPKKMPKGEYMVRVVPTNEKEYVSEDQSVVVKGGKGGLVFVTLLGAGGGAAYMVLGSGGGEDPGTNGGNSLPDPPSPGN